MKIGFNEGCNRFCENHSVLEDLDLCEKYGFDYIDIQSECLDREIAAGKYTIDDLGAWFADPKHHLKMLSYNALIFFNMKQTQEEKDAVMAKLDQIIADCNKLGCKMIVVVPSMDLTVPATVDEIREDAVAVLKEMVKKVEPHGIKLSIEFCGCPTMSINRFEYAYDIVTEVDHPLVGITLDQYHFHAMASSMGCSREGRRQEDFRMAPERHGEYAVRRCLQQRREASVAGRVGRLPGSQALRRYPQEDRL